MQYCLKSIIKTSQDISIIMCWTYNGDILVKRTNMIYFKSILNVYAVTVNEFRVPISTSWSAPIVTPCDFPNLELSLFDRDVAFPTDFRDFECGSFFSYDSCYFELVKTLLILLYLFVKIIQRTIERHKNIKILNYYYEWTNKL